MDKNSTIEILKFYRQINGEIATYKSIYHENGEIKEYKRKAENLQNLKTQILQEISHLNLKEKTIIFDYYIHGMKWEQVAEHNSYSARQCKNIRNMAIKTLSERFENNLYIKGFGKGMQK